jgi:hypothetical protein
LAEGKKGRYSDSPDQDIRTVIRQIEKNRVEERWEIYEKLGDYAPPMPPVPPLPDVPGAPAPPAPAMAPIPPMPPMIKGDEVLIEWAKDKETREEISIDMNRRQKELQENQLKAIEQSRLREELPGQLNGERQRELHQQLEKLLKNQQVKHDSIMQDHEARMKTHEGDMKKHAIWMEKHAAFMNIIENQLVKDGLVKAGQKIDIRMENGQLHINDQLQPAEVFHKYEQLIREEEKRSGDRMTEHNDIRFHLKLYK